MNSELSHGCPIHRVVMSSNPPVEGCICRDIIWRGGVGLRPVPIEAIKAGAAAAARVALLLDKEEQELSVSRTRKLAASASPKRTVPSSLSGAAIAPSSLQGATAGHLAEATPRPAASRTPAPAHSPSNASQASSPEADNARLIERIDPEAFAHVIVTMPGIFLGSATFERATAFVRGLETPLLLRIRTLDDIAALPTHQFRALMENEDPADEREAIRRLEPVIALVLVELQTMLETGSPPTREPELEDGSHGLQ